MLNRTGEVSQTELTDLFDVTSGSMSTMVDQLLKGGMIARRKNPEDRRGDLIEITPQGRAILNEVRDVWQDIDALIAAKLGSAKATQLTDLTRGLKFALGGRVPGPGRRATTTSKQKRTSPHDI